MAAAAVHNPKAKSKRGKSNDSLFWAKPGSSKMVGPFVPGVTLPEKGNLRPQIKGGRVKEVKAAVPLIQPEADDKGILKGDEEFQQSKAAHSAAASEITQSILDTDASTVTTLHDSKKVSLRDLCVEDKKRVANLIKELAKLGEEKESAERNLEEERRHYEQQILKLVDQQEEILKEREEVQQRMSEYQSYILKLHQQHKEEGLKRVQETRDARSAVQNALERRAVPAMLGNGLSPGACGSDRIAGDKGGSCSEEEKLSEAELELPSKHFYLNDFGEEEDEEEDDEDEEDEGNARSGPGLENFSTRVQPPCSPQVSAHLDDFNTISRGRNPHGVLKASDGRSPPRPDRPRPFTALIDKELQNQKRVMEIAVNNSAGNAPDAFGRGRSVEELFQGGRISVPPPLDRVLQPPPPPQLGGERSLKPTGVNVIEKDVYSSSAAVSPPPPPPRPPPPRASLLVRADESDPKPVFGGSREQQKIRFGEAAPHVGKELGGEDFPPGNLALLTPEKNELLSRFMQSHSELRFGGQGVGNVEENGLGANIQSKRTKKDLGAGGDGYQNGETKQLETDFRLGKDREERENAANYVYVENQENMIPERDGRTLRVSGTTSQDQPHAGDHSKTGRHHHHHRHSGNRKRRRPPPPSYGPLHPPVMSSTQKSHEIADFVSVTSTEVSVAEPLHHLRGKQQGHNPLKISPYGQDQSRENKNPFAARQSKSRISEKSVEFSENPAKAPREMAFQHEEDFMEKYRKMSPSERKRELLRQKSMLLEEQARLRGVLAGRENQLQTERPTKMEQVEDGGDKGPQEMHQSLLRLEAELAEKERELEEGRALLELKRQQTQAQRLSEANEAFLEDNVTPATPDHKKRGKATVFSSTPLTTEPGLVDAREKSTPGAAGAEGSAGYPPVKEQQPAASPSPALERKLTGKDGDGCVLYVSRKSEETDECIQYARDGGREAEARVVRKRDTETECDHPEKATTTQEATKTDDIAASDGRKVPPSRLTGFAAAAADDDDEDCCAPDALDRKHELRETVDVGTSISYATLPSVNPKRPAKPSSTSKVSPKREPLANKMRSARHSLSPGEKTLSVLEIINSLDDDVVAVTTSKAAATTKSTTRKARNSTDPLYASQNGNPAGVKIGPNAAASPRDTDLLQADKIGHSKKSGRLIKGQGVSLGIFGSTRLGGSGSFGAGYYSASQVVSEMASPSLGHHHHKHRHHHPGLDLVASAKLSRSGVGKSQPIRQVGSAALPETARQGKDENLDLFELKRILRGGGGGGSGAKVKVDDDDDVIDLILTSRRHTLRGFCANVEEMITPDLSAMIDNDDDDTGSNLDEIVRALEEEEEEDGGGGADKEEIVSDDGVYSRGINQRVKSEKFTNRRPNRGRVSSTTTADLDEEKLLEMIVRNMDDIGSISGGGDDDDEDDNEDNDDGDNDNNYPNGEDELLDDDIDDMYNDAKVSEQEDLEESQILEDVFFVQ